MSTFKSYLPLCWLGADPLDLPRSDTFFEKNIVFYFFVELFIQANMIDPSEAFFEVVLETTLTMGFVGLILLLNKTTHLYLQILTAVLFCENIVALFGVPVVIWLTVTDDMLSYILMGILVFWDYVLITYIVKKILSINILASLVISFFYFILTYFGAYSITVMLF